MKAARGQRGEVKRVLAARFCADEAALCGARKHSTGKAKTESSAPGQSADSRLDRKIRCAMRGADGGSAVAGEESAERVGGFRRVRLEPLQLASEPS
eukprot:146649-Rhodomonas_salina.1